MKEDPAPGAKCRDKFLVQSVVITPDRESVPLPELWKRLEDAEKARTDGGPSEIHEQKIRCTYLPAAEADVTHSAIPEEAVSDSQTLSLSPPLLFGALHSKSRSLTNFLLLPVLPDRLRATPTRPG